LPTPSRPGYNFQGWFRDPVSTAQPVASGNQFTFGQSITVWAHWTAQGGIPGGNENVQISIVFQPNGGTPSNTQTFNLTQAGAAAASWPTVTRVGFYNPQWRIGIGATQVFTTMTQVRNHALANSMTTITLTANWTERHIRVTYLLANDRLLSGVVGRSHTWPTAGVFTDHLRWSNNSVPGLAAAYQRNGLRVAGGRDGWNFYRWWDQGQTRVISNMDGVRAYLLQNNVSEIRLVAGWMPVYTYTIRFWFNDGTGNFAYRVFNHAEINNALTNTHLFYIPGSNPLAPNEVQNAANAIWRPGFRRIAWTTTPRTTQNVAGHITPHANNRLLPGRTINQLMLDPYYRVTQSGRDFTIHVYAMWVRL